MKTDQQQTGQYGEELAYQHLQEQRYEILETNWRDGRAEIDLIARSPRGILIFVEVKTRATDQFGEPEIAVDRKKQALLVKAATAYMFEHEYEGEIRFDVISIILPPIGTPTVRHLPDAFFPPLGG